MSTGASMITGIGSYIPAVVKTNADFQKHEFYGEDGVKINVAPEIITKKFEQITGIVERRYADENVNASDMAIIASRIAIERAGCDPETIDQIIVAHNFGNVPVGTIQTDVLPALASRVKRGLGIQNADCVPYDILFGCPGWLQGVIQADAFMKAGVAKKCLVVGTEALSRVVDHYDRDSMIFSDGAGACVLEWNEDAGNAGILSTAVQAHCNEEVDYINFGKSNLAGSDEKVRYIKMKGRKVYEYAMTHVPVAMKSCLEKAGIHIDDVKKVFLHQANEKMDETIIKELYKLYEKPLPADIMPMSIHKLGNSSVATIPTLYDLVLHENMDGHKIEKGDVVLFASVGAGMNINAVSYRL